MLPLTPAVLGVMLGGAIVLSFLAGFGCGSAVALWKLLPNFGLAATKLFDPRSSGASNAHSGTIMATMSDPEIEETIQRGIADLMEQAQMAGRHLDYDSARKMAMEHLREV